MLPFCGYHIGDYFQHWLAMGGKVPNPPRIFSVNWFRRDERGQFAWPGFAQNMRVLKWIVERCQERAHAVEGALGLQPEYADLDWQGLDFAADRFRRVMRVDPDRWQQELAAHDALFARLGAKKPVVLARLRERLGTKIQAAA